MKRFFARASKPITPAIANRSPEIHHINPTAGPSNPTAPHTTGLQPKYLVPAVPHPCPHDHIAILVTKDGLLLRPHIPGQGPTLPDPVSHVRIAWGKTVIVETVSGDGKLEGVEWSESVVVYGIVGVLELFSGSHLLVITSRSEVGNLIDPTHSVYGVKGVTAIPLAEERARIVVNTLASRNAAISRPSLLPTTTIDTIPPPQEPIADALVDLDEDATAQYIAATSPSRVQFSLEDQVKVMSPISHRHSFNLHADELGARRSVSPASSDLSGTSTPSSEYSVSTTPVAKTLASRLSFWSRLSQRTSTLPSTSTPGQDEPLTAAEPPTLIQEQEALDEIIREGKHEPAEVLENIIAATAPPPVTTEERQSELEDKIIKECIREFTKGGMYFAYNFDITRSLQHKQDQGAKSQKQHALLADLNALPSPESGKDSNVSVSEGEKVNAMSEPYPTLPLWRRVDRRFWWNEWMSKPFVDAGLHSYVLPIMQGHYQIAAFNVPPDPATHDEDTVVDYILVSRRSKDRAGLRYQRRGIDDDAHVANFVETETIMRVDRQGVENIFSYVQIRGSIPLFWTQTGYGLKPPPLLAPDRTRTQNLEALKRHFQRTIPHYGPHAVVNLAEQQGKEGAITQGYREYMKELNLGDAQYHEYDFHKETKGMKYENISKLIESMERNFDAQGYLWISDNTILSQQKGVFRVNCIDCLDRTNVVQSAFARHVLSKQLGAVALLNPSIGGRPEIDLVFNDVWANNGDAISRAYAGTSALKGDFTRTGKRDLGGMLNDGVNSLARMYTSTFSDWFCQAVIDFVLGNRTLSVFSEFLLKLQSTDPRDLIRLSKIRAEAIATSVSRVLVEGERLLAGWTLFAPEDFGVKIGEKFEEKVMLLTAKALYIISYDYTLEKVKLYTRVPLGDIVGIVKGAYILSPLEEASRDSAQNAGFVVTWLNSNQVTRVTSYSVRNSLNSGSMLPLLSSPPSRPTSPLAPRKDTSSPTPPIGIGGVVGVATFSVGTARTRFSALSRKGTGLTGTGAVLPPSLAGEKTFAAFKMLPINPGRVRRGSTGSEGGGGMDDELGAARSCREAVDLVVGKIVAACEDVGGGGAGFVTEEDVVSVAEAQRMTSMYAKMEYGVKRLLWLGG